MICSYYTRLGCSFIWSVRREGDHEGVHIYQADANSLFHLVQTLHFTTPLADRNGSYRESTGSLWNVEWSANSGHLAIYDDKTSELSIYSPSHPIQQPQWTLYKIFDIAHFISDVPWIQNVRYFCFNYLKDFHLNHAFLHLIGTEDKKGSFQLPFNPN